MLDLYSLTACDFRTVLDEFPGMKSLLADVAVERLQRLDKYSDEARQHQVKRYVILLYGRDKCRTLIGYIAVWEKSSGPLKKFILPARENIVQVRF